MPSSLKNHIWKYSYIGFSKQLLQAKVTVSFSYKESIIRRVEVEKKMDSFNSHDLFNYDYDGV